MGEEVNNKVKISLIFALLCAITLMWSFHLNGSLFGEILLSVSVMLNGFNAIVMWDK